MSSARAAITMMRPCRVFGRWGLTVRLAVDLASHPSLRELVLSGPAFVVLAHAAHVRAGGRPDEPADPVELIWWRGQWQMVWVWLVSAIVQVAIVTAMFALGAELSWWNGAIAGAMVGLAVGALSDVAICTPRRPRRWSR